VHRRKPGLPGLQFGYKAKKERHNPKGPRAKMEDGFILFCLCACFFEGWGFSGYFLYHPIAKVRESFRGLRVCKSPPLPLPPLPQKWDNFNASLSPVYVNAAFSVPDGCIKGFFVFIKGPLN
jgi:hypothetical protein